MTTGEQEQHPYWHGQEIVDAALAANKLAAAAAAFHRAVSLMTSAIAEAEADYDSIPADVRAMHDVIRSAGGVDARQDMFYPFTDRDSFAFAAAREDYGSLKILDSICGRYGADEPEPCSADYLRIVQTVQDMVAASEVTDIKDVRKVLSPTDRERLKSVWRAMRDAKILIVESQGQKVFFHRSNPVPAPSVKPTPFRKGQPVAETVLLKRPEHLKFRVWDRPEGRGPSFDHWPVATAKEAPVPKDLRRTRKSESVSVGKTTWLQGVTVNKRTDGSIYTPTQVIKPDGTTGPAVDLDYYGMLRSNPQGDCGISIDRDSVVRIYTPDAEQVHAFSLFATPEVRATIRSFGDKGLKTTSAIRSVHASLAAERLVISVINKVFVYSFDGEVIAAFHLDDERTSEAYEFVDVSSSKADWAYFVQLAADGQGLYIGAYSGLLLHLSFSGELIDSWVLPWAPRVLRETDEGVSGLCDPYFFRADRGSGDADCLIVDSGGLPQLLGSHVLLDTWTASGIFDLDTFEGRTVALPKSRTAAYTANGGLVMETATSRFTF